MRAGEALVREWALHVFQMAFQGTIVAAVLLPLAAAARRAVPAFRSALLAIALAKFVLPPMLPFPTGVFSRFDAAPQAFFSRFGVPACAAIAAVHVAGFAVSLARLAAVRRRTREWIRRSAVRDAGTSNVRTSAAVPVPCAVGGRRPAILLPERLVNALGSAELDAVIRHEREHLERRDPAMTAFESVVGAFWWFHPVVRVLIARRRAIREERCDDAVVARVPPAVYRRALVATAALAGEGRPAVAVGATGPAGELARRLRRLETGRPPARRRFAAAFAIAAAAALLVPGVRPAVGHAFPFVRTSR